ncbi:MAG TPA: SLBB domain-containing protein [Patescibacteria group bacterium]|nr:SLBB domain-containing protein [Patescibacteria group bacterium]
MKIISRLIIVVFFFSLSAALAQDGGGTFGGSTSSSSRTSQSSGGSYYDYNLGGGLKIPVNLWGFVRNPGRYVVPSSTTLVQLISFGGGPSEQARMTDIKIIRDISVDSTIVEKVLVMNLELFQKNGDENQNPILYPGDTIVVPGNALSAFQLYFGILRDVVLVVVGIIGVVNTFRN